MKNFLELEETIERLKRENAELKRLIADPNAMHYHYLRQGNGWEVWSTERIRNMDRDNAQLERENTELADFVELHEDALRLLRIWAAKPMHATNCDDLREETIAYLKKS